ncbi:hypothetical protein [Sphingosinicella sp. BN140058]|uniref:hypothetical protein n=1 Tax=Sphingosinicella sp. BN140058 TaxID=1892855 RepID=UPI00101343B8|nr:hypothetical protein [Sphingosinicella sp. BN140058]QAY77578.1 hypothetical protein ETR14_14465 [Sphingosinicella sp. BN140058]
MRPLPFDAARDAVTLWRGRGLDLFARSEVGVTEMLLVLAAVDTRGASIKLPHLGGRRYDALAKAIESGGAFGEEGKAAAGPLATFRQHNRLRSAITHETFAVSLDKRGRWHLIVRVLALTSGSEARDVLVLQEKEAEAMMAKVAQCESS